MTKKKIIIELKQELDQAKKEIKHLLWMNNILFGTKEITEILKGNGIDINQFNQVRNIEWEKIYQKEVQNAK